MARNFGAPIRATRDGRYRVRLDPALRTVLGSVSEQMVPVIDSGDPATRRLFPPAYVAGDRAKEEADYRTMVDGALSNHHRRALDTLARSAQAESLSADELADWLSAVGTIRLVLGTRLDVTEDMTAPPIDDPDAPVFEVYELLGWLQDSIVEVLAADLPEEGTADSPGRPL